MEMLRSSESQFMGYENSSTDSPHYLIDNFYENGWANPPKSQVYYTEGENQGKEAGSQNLADSSILTSWIDPQSQNHAVPKLEDFLGDSSSMVRYSDSQTETQDSSLTQIYDQGSAYFNEQQDLKAFTGFQAFSTNSGSEVDDSASIARTQLACAEFAGQSIESAGTELGFSNRGTARGALSLGVTQSSEKAIVSVESDSSTKKIADTFGQRTSIYRGVTRHRWTGRYEAHLWDNSCRREGQARKGRQGGYDKEEKAARAYDLAALKYWGPTATTNFPVSNYTKELEEMKHVTKQEFIASLRRHHQQGRWQARIGRVAGNKDLYLGTFEEAAEAYDIAAIKFRGANAVTNFEMNRYDVEAIANSSLPIGGAAKRLKLSLESEQKPVLTHTQQPQCSSGSNSINFAAIQPLPAAIPCGIPIDASTAFYHQNLFQHLQANNMSTSDSPGSSTIGTPMNIYPPAAEFFLWPPQSY
uniref:AP2/ERF domain-containing protein n=1 Tax=Fagus sylvatica TaxID=28930 RepID=A0A2N9EF82_FAGSY